MSNGIDPTFPINASAAGGTDNPGNVDKPGHGVQVETGAPRTSLLTVPGQGSDNTVAGTIPPSGGGGHVDTSADPEGGVTREPDGTIRESGEGETSGATGGGNLGQSPDHFPGL